MRRDRWIVLAVVTLLIFPAFVWAQTPGRPLRVATRIVPPFVLEEGSKLTGFSVDLWHNISDEIKIKSEFLVRPTVKDLLATIKDGTADLGIAAISITAERDKDFDFSQPMFDSGLQILVRAESGGVGFLPSLLGFVFSYAVLPLIGVILVAILVPAHLVWWCERGEDRGIIEKKSYFPGIFEACWWSLSTLATQADQMPKSPVGRIIAVFWMFASVVFVAYFTANVTASLTVQQLQGDIKGPEDLPGKLVATTTGSTSAAYLRQQNVPVREFSRIEEAYEALLVARVDAVVFDSPVLLYYAAREGKGKVHVVGPVFREEKYGIVFPPDSSYRKPIDNALLTLKENGTYQKLYDKWFGSK